MTLKVELPEFTWGAIEYRGRRYIDARDMEQWLRLAAYELEKAGQKNVTRAFTLVADSISGAKVTA